MNSFTFLFILCILNRMCEINCEFLFRHLEFKPEVGNQISIENDENIEVDIPDDVTLDLIISEITDLKGIVQQQTTLIKYLISVQKHTEKENSKWLKKYRSTRRFLKKLNKSCVYQPQNNLKGMTSQFNDNLTKSVNLAPVQNIKETRELKLSNSKPDNILKRVLKQDVDLKLDARSDPNTTLPGPQIFSTTESLVKPAPKQNENLSDINQTPNEFYELEIDLSTGRYSGRQFGISWISNLTRENTAKCDLQGVVKLTFPPVLDHQRQETIMIDMMFDTPTGWVFNIGDSRSNDGMSGDGSVQENDSEAEGFGTTFTVYGSDKNDRPFNKVLHKITKALKQKMTVLVTNEAISWKTESGDLETLNNTSLFALKGQSDSQGPVNYDIYFSMNRVIAGNYRSGSGLCKVAFKWLQSNN